MARITVEAVATALDVLPESIRYTCNRMHIPVAEDGSFEFPVGGQAQRWHRLLVCQPLNPAERLRADLGIRPPRRMPSE